MLISVVQYESVIIIYKIYVIYLIIMISLYIHPSLLSLPHLPKSHSSRSSQVAKLNSLCYITTSYCFTHDNVYMLMLLFQLAPHLPSPATSKVCSLLGLLVLFLLIPHICINTWYLFFFFFFLIYFTLCEALGSSNSLQHTLIHSFLWLSNIILYISTTSSLSLICW